MKRDLLLAIDQGTTGTTSLVMDLEGKTLARKTIELPQHYPQPGWVEHDAADIWAGVEASVTGALAAGGIDLARIAGIGITNQRETTLLWDRSSGEQVHRAIVWQDRRTADACAKLRAGGHEAEVKRRTGLVLDPYFSGTKLAWLLEHVPSAPERATRGELAFGTVDSFVTYKLSGGARHVTDVSNASRTLLFDLHTLAWSDEMLALLGIPRALLPEVVPSAGPIATTKGLGFLPDGLPIAGIAGDQQAALFGQACFGVGDAKCTYGTGAFALVNVGATPRASERGMLATVAWKVGDQVAYALEGSAFIAGAAVQWLRDGLGIIQSASEIEALARSVPDTGGVAFVPALTGLGAPHWDPHARGLLTGITRGTGRAHVARAVLEGIAFSVGDLLRAMTDDLGARPSKLRVDGGAAANDLLMQLQADLSRLRIERPAELESTARGAAMLAGVGVGLFASIDEASRMSPAAKRFEPELDDDATRAHWDRWSHAVKLATTH
jgi:glycerol kinase